VIFFGEFDGEREEIDSFLRRRRRTDGGEHTGVAVRNEDGSVGLLCKLSGFDRELCAADLRRHGFWIKKRHADFLSEGDSSGVSPTGWKRREKALPRRARKLSEIGPFHNH